MQTLIDLAIGLAFLAVYLWLFERHILNPRDRSARGSKAQHTPEPHHEQHPQPAQR